MVKDFRQKILAFLLGLFLIGLVEAGLWLVGVNSLADEDRFVGFSGGTPLFVADETRNTETVYALNPVKGDYFNPQSFSMPKPEGVFRVVALGGSTTYGRPYLGETAFVRWLTLLGNRFDMGGKYEEINAGGISYASYRATRLQEELLAYSPDLFVVYSGHNEFLEARTFAALKDEEPWVGQVREGLHYSRLYSLLARSLGPLGRKFGQNRTQLSDEVSVELETVVGPDYYHRDDDFREGVLIHYRESLQRMIERSIENRVPLVLCTLPSNLSGISPFKSEHLTGLAPQQLAAWEKYFAQGNQSMAAGEIEQAIDSYQRALQIDDRYALLLFRYGHALLQKGRLQQAYRAFVMAKQEDIIPLRALVEMNAIVRELADEYSVPLADVESMFRRVAVDGIPGNDLFDDHVHPNIRGQQLIAWAVFDTLVKSKMIPLELSQWKTRVGEARALLMHHEQEISLQYRALGLFGVGRLYFWAGKYAEAYSPLKQASTVLDGIPEIPFKLGALEVFRGDGAAAIPLLLQSLELEPDNHDAVVMLANAYLLEAQPVNALEQLGSLPDVSDNSIGSLSALGRARMQLGDYDAGLRALAKAYQIAPDVPRSAREYAEALAIDGQMGKARELFLQYLALIHSPDPDGTLRRWVSQKGWEAPRRWLSKEIQYR